MGQDSYTKQDSRVERDLGDKYKLAYQKITKANNILIVGHLNPDGDDLASICLLMELFKDLNKNYTAYCEHKLDNLWPFLPQQEAVLGNKTLLQKKVPPDFSSNNYLDYFDLIIALDCGSLHRTNLSEEITRRGRVGVMEFDHHLKVDDYAELEIRLPDKASTTEVLYNFLKANQITLTKNIATCILTGILTDTGNFLYSNASRENLLIASEMLSLGANFNQIINQSLNNKNLTTIRLLSRAIANLQINAKEQIAISVLRPEDFTELGRDFAAEAFDDIVAVLANLKDVKAVLLLREYEPGKIKGSWRSQTDGYDVSKFAQTLGGGGHKHASGFQIDGRIIKKDGRWKIETAS